MSVESILEQLVDETNAKSIIAIVEEKDGVSSYIHGHGRDVVSAIIFQMHKEEDIASILTMAVLKYLEMQEAVYE